MKNPLADSISLDLMLHIHEMCADRVITEHRQNSVIV